MSLFSTAPPDTATDMLCAMEHASRFNRWMADTILPFVRGDVLEIGAGIGNLTRLLYPHSSSYILTDLNPEHISRAMRLLAEHSKLSSAICDVTRSADFEPFREKMDTVICLNVLEHVANDLDGLRNIYLALRPGGRAIILVPQGPGAFGSFDRILGHFRRYTKQELTNKILTAGFVLEHLFAFNRATYPGWLLNSKLLKRKRLSRIQLAMFDRMVPILRHVDAYLPWPATSLIAICRRPS
jgi:SAM-dependent methyltransferase